MGGSNPEFGEEVELRSREMSEIVSFLVNKVSDSGDKASLAREQV